MPLARELDPQNSRCGSRVGAMLGALAGGVANSVATGEGFEFQFKGPCDIFLQSGSKDLFVGMLARSPEFMQQLAQAPSFAAYIEQQLTPANERIAELEREMKAHRAALSGAALCSPLASLARRPWTRPSPSPRATRPSPWRKGREAASRAAHRAPALQRQ